MPRFTFTRGLSNNPSSEDYNQIVTDFKDFIGTTKLSEDNLENKAVRYRHIVNPPVVLLAKDCSEFIWNAEVDTAMTFEQIGTYGSYGLYRDTQLRSGNRCKIEYNAREDSIGGHPLVEFNIWYYPYCTHSSSKIAPGVRLKATGEWVVVDSHQKHIGANAGFHTKYSQTPYTANRLYDEYQNVDNMLGKHPYFTAAMPFDTSGGRTGLSRYDRLGTEAFGSAVICTMSVGKAGVKGYRLDQIDAYGMMILQNTAEDAVPVGEPSEAVRVSRVSRHDRLFMSLTVREA